VAIITLESRERKAAKKEHVEQRCKIGDLNGPRQQKARVRSSRFVIEVELEAQVESTLSVQFEFKKENEMVDVRKCFIVLALFALIAGGAFAQVTCTVGTTQNQLIRAAGLTEPVRTVTETIARLGYIQIDPMNVCGRMHDLILRNRVVGYREGDLFRNVHGGTDAAVPPLPASQRTAFEHHHPGTHVLVAFPLEAWPHLLASMRARSRRTSAWSGRLTPRERALAPEILAEIAERGPLGSEDFVDDRRARRPVWGKSSLVKNTMQKLFFHGKLLIAQRRNNRRCYDVPERVLPPETLEMKELPASDTTRWVAVLKLRQRRLVTLKREELRVLHDLVQPVKVEGCPTLYCLHEDIALLDAAAPAIEPGTRLLAPLDPLIYDRRVTAALWNFDYTWEAYTPPAKRVRGHYALPVLAGLELVGHVEPKADRARGRLEVASRSVRRGVSTAAALDELADWLGLRRK
jgi:uncharacterized protein YcaQ